MLRVKLSFCLSFVALACSSPASPSTSLSGTWGGLLTELHATPDFADLKLRCLIARFDPIHPDADGYFALEGAVRSASWPGGVGIPFRISGRVHARTIDLERQIMGTEDWAEPKSVLLKADTVGDFTSVGGGCIV